MSYVTADFYGGTYLIARVGAPNAWDGVLRLWNRSNSYYTEFRAVAFAADIALNLPDSFPSDNTYLKHTSGGTLTWAAVTGGTSGTTFATLTADYIYATNFRYGSLYGGYGSFATSWAEFGTYGTIRSRYGTFAQLVADEAQFGTIYGLDSFATLSADYITAGYATFGTLGTIRSPYAIITLAELTKGIFTTATVLGTFRSLFGSVGYLNGAVGTFGTIHNFPEYTPPATYSGDLFVGPRGSFSTVVVDLISAVNGGIDDLNVNNVYGDTATLNSAKISFNIRVATIAGQYGTFGYLYGAVGTFGTIHNYPIYTLPATVTADLFKGTYGQIEHGTFATVKADYGTSGTWRAQSVYGWRVGGNNIGAETGLYSLYLGAATYWGSSAVIGTHYGDNGTFTRLSVSGTFLPTYIWSAGGISINWATFGGDIKGVGNNIWTGTSYFQTATVSHGSFTNISFGSQKGGYGEFTNMQITHATVYVRIAGNLAYFGTVTGSNIARNIYTSFGENTSHNGGASVKRFTQSNSAEAQKVFVPFTKYGGDKHIHWRQYCQTSYLSTGVMYTLYVGSLSVGTTCAGNSNAYIDYFLDISAIANGNTVVATLAVYPIDAGDIGTFFNVTLDVVSREYT